MTKKDHVNIILEQLCFKL